MAAFPLSTASSSPWRLKPRASPRRGSPRIRWSAAPCRPWRPARRRPGASSSALASGTPSCGIRRRSPWTPARSTSWRRAVVTLGHRLGPRRVRSGGWASTMRNHWRRSRTRSPSCAACCAGETVTYKGKVFAVDGVKLSYRPSRPDLPILMAARGSKALELCGSLADGLMVSNMCPPGFAAWARLDRAAGATGAIRALRRRRRSRARRWRRSSPCWPACSRPSGALAQTVPAAQGKPGRTQRHRRGRLRRRRRLSGNGPRRALRRGLRRRRHGRRLQKRIAAYARRASPISC